MRDKPIFIDTNILIYAHDLDAKEKHKLAKEKLTYLWNLKLPPSISIQVLQEFYVNLVKKEVPLKIARETVLSYLEWDVIQNDEGLLLEGIRIKERYNLSFWMP